MRLGAILRFELRLQVRRPTTWIYAALFIAGAAGIAANYLYQARHGGSHFNAPVAIAAAMVMATLVGLLTAAALAADTATRDTETRLAPLLFTTPLRRHEYLGGRFLAAFLLYALLLAIVPIGLMAAEQLPGIAPELLGPFRARSYLEAYLFLALPNALATTAVLFAVAALSRSPIATYVAAVLLFIGTMVSFQLSTTLLAGSDIAGLLDPFGFGATRRLTAGWTIAQRNALPVALAGELLWNRVVWMTVTVFVLGVTWWRFAEGQDARSNPIASRWRSRTAEPPSRRAAEVGSRRVAEPRAIPNVSRQFGLPTRIRQTLAVARRAFLDVATSRGAFVMIGFAALRALTGAEILEHMGVPVRATTGAVIAMLSGGEPAPPLLLLPAALAIFYAGELVWKERDLRLASLTGAAPIGGWTILLGKFLGLALVLAAFQALLIAAGLIVQWALDAPEIDLSLYAATMLGIQLAGYLTIAAIAIVAQVLTGGKYVGWLVAVAAFVVTALGRNIGAEHPLLAWTAGPEWTWTELRGFGASLAPALWFKAYWAAWAVLLALVARLFVVRGIDLPWRERLSRARERFTARLALGTLGAAGAVCGLGGFIFWNMNVLNDYETADGRIAHRAEYERRYGMYEGVPQPRLLAESARIELYPSDRTADVQARLLLLNGTGLPLDTIHLATASEVETGDVSFDRPARAAVLDDRFGHRIYVLESPLLPGDSLAFDVEVRYRPRGFTQSGAQDAVVANGTLLVLSDWLPAIGYQRDRELSGGPVRTQEGLPPRPRRGPENDAVRFDVVGRERVDLHLVIGTEEGEIAAAPGVLQRSWNENGRAYFEYAAAAPVLTDAAILSAEYAVHRSEWQGIPIEVLHAPAHAWNAERTARSIAASLEYFTRELGPYPFAVVRAVERPLPGIGASAYPGMIAYSEGMALMHPEADPRGLDFPFAVMAHEMAHMWWGNQLVPANADGGALLAESLAWYGAFGVVEETYGTAHLGLLLDIMREAYLAPMPRAGVPLLQGHDWFQAYRRGAFAMYAAREYLGEEQVSAALRRVFAAHAHGRTPLPTSLDLYRELLAETPDSLETLVGDLFERNVWWELTAKRADAEQLPSGEWRVTLGVNVRRIEADTLRETPLAVDEIVQVGVYGADPDAEPLYLRTHRIREREQTITLTVAERPARAGIDPNHLLLDDDPWDNVLRVEPTEALRAE